MTDPAILECYFDFNLYISSRDSIKHYPGNHFNDFRVDLPKTLRLAQVHDHKWCVELTDAVLLSSRISVNIPESIVILLDLVEPSIITGSFHPVLRRLWKNTEGKQADIANSVICPLRVHRFDTVHIKVLNEKLEPLDLNQWDNIAKDNWKSLELSCLLNFQLLAKPAH